MHIATLRNFELSENDIVRDIRDSLQLGERSVIKLSEAARYMGLKPEVARLELRDVPKVNLGKYGRYHVKSIARFLRDKKYYEF